jgi:hypothetical protein
MSRKEILNDICNFKAGHLEAGLYIVDILGKHYMDIPKKIWEDIGLYFNSYDYEAKFWIDQE